MFDLDGKLTASAAFGDGIEQVLSTPTGNSWVGYFDEGIFGNLGWNDILGPEPIGQFGINRFDENLGLVAHAPGGLNIASCYALTTDGETAWAYCYTDWDIIRLDTDGRTTPWSNTIAGAGALLTRFPHIALIGGYPPDRNRVVTGVLDGPDFKPQSTSVLTVDGHQILDGAIFQSRGHELHAYVDGSWQRSEL